MIRTLVLKYGRPTTWAILIAGYLLVALITLTLMFFVSSRVADHSAAEQGEPPVGPAEALQAGGHTVAVCVVCAGTGTHIREGQFLVITHDGRPPSEPRGPLSGNLAQIVVGPDWIGRVKILAEFDDSSNDTEVFTDLIGEAYGWHQRVLEVPCPTETTVED